jgi:hypothetical protein
MIKLKVQVFIYIPSYISLKHHVHYAFVIWKSTVSLNKQSMTALKCKYITASIYMSDSSPQKYCYWYISHNILTNQLMKQSPYTEDNSSSSPRWEISHGLQNLKVHYFVHKSMSRVLVLSQINPLHACPSRSFKIHSHTVSLKYILILSSYAP